MMINYSKQHTIINAFWSIFLQLSISVLWPWESFYLHYWPTTYVYYGHNEFQLYC